VTVFFVHVVVHCGAKTDFYVCFLFRMGTIGNFYGKSQGSIGAALAIKPGRSVSPSLLLLHWGSIGICHRTHVL
jgi:hypothetical protein